MKILTNVLLCRNSNITHAIGYIDTGNSLRCQLTGRYVAVANYAVISTMITSDENAFIHSYLQKCESVYDGSKPMPEGIKLAAGVFNARRGECKHF